MAAYKLLVERIHANKSMEIATNHGSETKNREKRAPPQQACEYLPGCWQTNNATCKTTTSYNGTLGVTLNGYYCQNWMSNTPNSHSHHIGNFSYCRNPDSSSGPWCYTTSPVQRWDYCMYDITTCLSPEPICEYLPGCWSGSILPFCTIKASYRGSQNVTAHGIACQNWNMDLSPHQVTPASRNMGNHNHCRNPDGSTAPWCYTVDPLVRFDYCFLSGSTQDCAAGSGMTCFDSGNCWYENSTFCNTPYYSKLANRTKTLSSTACVNWLTTSQSWMGNTNLCV